MKISKKILLSLLLILSIIISINFATAKENSSVLFGENYIIDNSGIISDTYINLINEKNKELFNESEYNIYVYIPTVNEYAKNSDESLSSQLDSFTSKLYDQEILSNKDILLVVDLENRYMSIEYDNTLYNINKSNIIQKYSKNSFAENNFNKAILETVEGIIEINNESSAFYNENTYQSIEETIIFDSYIIDQTNSLSSADLDYLESNAYKINNNYDYRIYIGLLNSKEYDPTSLTNKIYHDNFSLDMDVILVIFYMDTGKISTMSSPYIYVDALDLYDTYSKEYFHSTPANYKDGLYELQNAIISDIENVTTNEIKEVDISGSQKAQTSEDVNIIFSYLKIICFVIIMILIICVVILSIRKLLLTEEKMKNEILNNEPEKAFLNLEKEITKKEDFITDDKMNVSMDELYRSAAEEMWEKSLEKQEYKKESTNIFDSSFNDSSNNENVINSINDMIIKLVERANGTKEFYQELQSALDVYNGLTFSDRMKLDRKYTSELEQLTRKAKIDKELYEKHIEG